MEGWLGAIEPLRRTSNMAGTSQRSTLGHHHSPEPLSTTKLGRGLSRCKCPFLQHRSSLSDSRYRERKRSAFDTGRSGCWSKKGTVRVSAAEGVGRGLTVMQGLQRMREHGPRWTRLPLYCPNSPHSRLEGEDSRVIKRPWFRVLESERTSLDTTSKGGRLKRRMGSHLAYAISARRPFTAAPFLLKLSCLFKSKRRLASPTTWEIWARGRGMLLGPGLRRGSGGCIEKANRQTDSPNFDFGVSNASLKRINKTLGDFKWSAIVKHLPTLSRLTICVERQQDPAWPTNRSWSC